MSNPFDFRIGYCSQCGDRIMTKNTKGVFDSIRSNYTQIDVEFPDDTKIRFPVCKECAKSPDYDILMTGLLGKGSQARLQEVKKLEIQDRYQRYETPRRMSRPDAKLENVRTSIGRRE